MALQERYTMEMGARFVAHCTAGSKRAAAKPPDADLAAVITATLGLMGAT